MNKFLTTICFLILCHFNQSNAQPQYDIIVNNQGEGNFKTITEAIESLPEPNFKRIVILVKNGSYNEKIKINRDFVTIIGENKEQTSIQYEQLKKEWLPNKDYEGIAVVNIESDNVIIENITLRNLSPKIGPTALAINGTGTRTTINNCNIFNNGANTVSLMNYKDGMYYLKNCYIEGTVDFMRAMGWCLIEDCHFFQKEAISSLWHACINNPNQKMVVTNCSFDGVEHYFIGRHHYDAQFFLINCNFNSKLADLPIYRKKYTSNPNKEKPDIYGNRYYYYNCTQNGTNYSWLKNNLEEYKPPISANDINSTFTFDGQWNPESPKNIEVVNVSTKNDLMHIEFNQPVTASEDLKIEIGNTQLEYYKGQGFSTLVFKRKEDTTIKTNKEIRLVSGSLIPCVAYIGNYKQTEFNMMK